MGSLLFLDHAQRAPAAQPWCPLSLLSRGVLPQLLRASTSFTFFLFSWVLSQEGHHGKALTERKEWKTNGMTDARVFVPGPSGVSPWLGLYEEPHLPHETNSAALAPERAGSVRNNTWQQGLPPMPTSSPSSLLPHPWPRRCQKGWSARWWRRSKTSQIRKRMRKEKK